MKQRVYRKQTESTFNKKVLSIVTLLIITGGLLFTGCGEKNNIKAGENDVLDSNYVSEPLATVFFASDYQYEEGWGNPSDTLSDILEQVVSDGKTLDEIVICGDYTNDAVLHDYQLSPDESIDEIKDVVKSRCSNINDNKMLFVQGNHDRLTDLISPTGLYEFDNYFVYILNTQNDFPWKQGKESGSYDKVKNAANELEECLAELIQKDETRPVFIAGYVPLHFSARTSSMHSTGDNLYSSLIFNEINEAAEYLDIVYLFGHNHSKGWDCYLGGGCVYQSEGENLIIPKFTDTSITSDEFEAQTLNFTYLNAGYIGYYMNCSSAEVEKGMLSEYAAADDTLTGTIVEVFDDRLEITRYDTNGHHQIRATGEADPYMNYIDKSLISPHYYSTAKKGTQTVERNIK